MNATQNTLKLTMPAADAKHMVRVLNKAANSSTLSHSMAQFVSDTAGAVTLHTEADGTGSGYGITYVTQEYPKVAANTPGVTVAAPAPEVKKKLHGAIKDAKDNTVTIAFPTVPGTSECTLDSYTGVDCRATEYSVMLTNKGVHTIGQQSRFARDEKQGFEVVAFAYSPGGDTVDAYISTRRVIAHHRMRVLNAVALGNWKESNDPSSDLVAGDVFLPIAYDVWDVYQSAKRGSAHTVIEHTGDGGRIILSGGGTVVRYVSLGEAAIGQRVRKYLQNLHKDNKAGVSSNHQTLPVVCFDRKKLKEELENLVKSTGGSPGSKNLDSNVLFRGNEKGGLTFFVRNWDNLQITEANSEAVLASSDKVVWEPTTYYCTNPENKEQLEEADRQPVTYNTRSLLRVLTMTDDEFVTLMPPKYFSDTMVVFLSNNPGSDLVHGSWVFLPCTMMELSQRREQKIRDNTTEDKKQRPQTTFNPQIDRIQMRNNQPPEKGKPHD